MKNGEFGYEGSWEQVLNCLISLFVDKDEK